MCIKHNKNKSGSASVADGVAYFLKFQYVTDAYISLRRRSQSRCKSTTNTDLYQNYLSKDKEDLPRCNGVTINNNLIPKKRTSEDSYCSYLEDAIFGSPDVVENVNLDNLVVKRNNTGLVPKFMCDEKKSTDDIIRHNLQKVQFYEQKQACSSLEDVFVSLYLVILVINKKKEVGEVFGS